MTTREIVETLITLLPEDRRDLAWDTLAHLFYEDAIRNDENNRREDPELAKEPPLTVTELKLRALDTLRSRLGYQDRGGRFQGMGSKFQDALDRLYPI